jgi:hypothetical protein
MDKKIIKNKYNIELYNFDACNYFNSLIGNFYKLLPIYEGKDVVNKNKIYTKEESYLHFQVYLSNFIIELSGGCHLFYENNQLIKLLTSLEGLRGIGINHHDEVKSVTFNCINICNKIIKKLESE